MSSTGSVSDLDAQASTSRWKGFAGLLGLLLLVLGILYALALTRVFPKVTLEQCQTEHPECNPITQAACTAAFPPTPQSCASICAATASPPTPPPTPTPPTQTPAVTPVSPTSMIENSQIKQDDLCLNIQGSSTQPGAIAVLWNCSENIPSSKFTLDQNTRKLVAMHAPNLCVTSAGYGTTGEGSVTLQNCTGAPNQQWQLGNGTMGTPELNACMQATADQPNAPVIMQDCVDTPLNKWSV